MGPVGFEEMMVIVVVAILIFGKQLPSVARKMGGWYGKLKRHLGNIKDEIERQIPVEELNVDPSASGGVPNPPLPGPDPADPEYKPPNFDPAKPAADGNGHVEPAPEKKA